LNSYLAYVIGSDLSQVSVAVALGFAFVVVLGDASAPGIACWAQMWLTQ
jgi:hypothetical protein